MNIDVNKVKIIVTIPVENLDDVRNAICEGANPYIGEKNKLEFVQEEKLEVRCSIDKVKEVISKLREVHPYEEPAIDIIPLIDESCFK